MYARTITWRISAQSVDDFVAHVRNELLPVLAQIDGFVGLSLVVDRDTGRCISTSAWPTADALRASYERMSAPREETARIFGTAPEEQDWEIAVLHRAHPTAEGAAVRLVWSRTQPENVTGVIAAYRESLMPWWQETPGFRSNSLLVDRDGRLASTVAFESREAMAHTRDQFTTLREEFTQRMGLEILEVAEFELALAHLRVPETV